MIEPIIKGIMDATIEAQKRGIKANAVFINNKLYFSKIQTAHIDIPIICGLKAFYTEELPEDVLFAVSEANNLPSTKEEYVKKLESENAMLKKRLENIGDILKGGEVE